jgi:hypothetical protein
MRSGLMNVVRPIQAPIVGVPANATDSGRLPKAEV